MARQELALQVITSTGVNVAYSTPTVDGFMASSDGDSLLHVTNNNAGSVTVTLQTWQTVDGLAVADLPIVIPTTQERFIRLKPEYIRPDGLVDRGKVYVDFSPFASVLVALVHH